MEQNGRRRNIGERGRIIRDDGISGCGRDARVSRVVAGIVVSGARAVSVGRVDGVWAGSRAERWSR